MDKTKLTIILAILAMVAMTLASNWKQDADRAEFAKNNNCEWSATGSAYGDDRDFICK